MAEVHLQLDAARVTGRREPLDVTVTVEPTQSVGALTTALARAVGLRPTPDWCLHRQDGVGDGAVLDPAASVAGIGLVSGQRLTLIAERGQPEVGRPPEPVPTLVPSPEPARALELVSCAGPDVGRSCTLPTRARPLTIGRDPRCWFTLSDPGAARVNAEISLGAHHGIGPAAGVLVAPVEGRVLIDGAEIEGSTPLQPHQVLRLGSSALRLRVVDPTAPTTGLPGTGPSQPVDPAGAVGIVALHRTPYRPAVVPDTVLPALGEVPRRADVAPFALLPALMPLVLGVGLALVYSPRFLVFALFSPLVAAAGYLDQRRRNRRRFEHAVEEFEGRVAERVVEVEQALAIERQRRFRAAPDLIELAARAAEQRPDLWNRDRSGADRLTLRLGLADLTPTLEVEPETTGDAEVRAELAGRLDGLVTMAQVPLTLDLDQHPVCALVGRAPDTTALAASLLIQACCLHSPEDLVVAAATRPGPDSGIGPGTGTGEDSLALARWLKWLPHCRVPHSPLSGAQLSTTADGGERLLTDLVTLAERRSASGERNPDRVWPRLLVVIEHQVEPDPALVARLLDLAPSAGLAVVWLAAERDRIPRQAVAVVDCAPLMGPHGALSQLSLVDDDAPPVEVVIERLDPEQATGIARALAPLRDAGASSAAAAVPSEVTLAQTLGVSPIGAAQIRSWWARDEAGSPLALAAPVGMTANGPLSIDLVADGPHGLIGGTSGAGKSELIMSLVGGLLAHHPPERVNILFIDYKGGAAAAAFAAVPHTVGCVTNLDARLAHRALASLGAELNRRMALLDGRAKDLVELAERHPGEVPPSLVIVVDEFATLVKEIPDFVAGIVDLAQRGRSLGIHLLLATQRPTGAVNENILANTNIRLSLRTLSPAESSSIIGSDEAASIPTSLKGRGLVRLGPGDLTLFQTAWSGAPAAPASGPRPIQARPFLIERAEAPTGALPAGPADGSSPETGSPDDSSPDDSSADDGSPEGQIGDDRPPTQLDELVAAVIQVAGERGAAAPFSPWLDELPARLPIGELRSRPAVRPEHDDEDGPEERAGPTVPIGLIDDPARQAQYPAVVDFDTGGVLIIGGAGTGKTTALHTLAVGVEHWAAARGHRCTIFGFDFASRQLGAVATLPTCVEVAAGDDLEAVTRIVATVEAEVERRQRKVGLTVRSGGGPPRFDPVLLLIDDYAGLVQAFEGAGVPASHYPWLERINGLVVDGRQVGVHAAVTVAQLAGVRSKVRTALTNRFVLHLGESTAYAELGIGPAARPGPDQAMIPGRAVIGSGLACQLAIAPPEPEADPDGGEPRSRPQVELVTAPLPRRVSSTIDPPAPAMVRLGVADLGNAPVDLDLGPTDLAIIGEPGTGRSTTLATIAHQLLRAGTDVWTLGPTDSPLAAVPAANGAFGPLPTLVDLLDRLGRLVGEQAGDPSDRAPVLLVDDLDLLDDPQLERAAAIVVGAGCRVVAATTDLRGFSTNPLVQTVKKARAMLHLSPPGAREVQEITGARVGIRPGLGLGPGRGVLVVNRHPTVLAVNSWMGPGESPPPTRSRAPGRSEPTPAFG